MPRPLIIATSMLALASCSSLDRVAAPSSAPTSAGVKVSASRETIIRVSAGGSIQAAVDALGTAGGTVLIEAGTYRESVSVTAADVRLIGLGTPGGVVLENPGGANNGIRVTSSAAGFELDNVTVRGFNRNGVILVGVDGFRLTRVRTENDGEYGIFPVRSSRGLIAECSASGAADTGIYVGQSTDIEIRNSVAWGNVAGFELENTHRVSLVESTAYDNTVGVLVSLVPGLPVMTASDNIVTHNAVFDNNRPNFGDPDDLAGRLPSGVGILVIGPDRTLIAHNTVTGNVSAGVALVSASLLLQLAGLPPDAFGGIDPNSDETRVEFNAATGNGTAPTINLFPGVDLLWDGTGVGNCWLKNRFGSSAPPTLPACA